MVAVVRLITCAVTLAWLVLMATAGSADVQAIDAQQPATSPARAAISPQRALLNQYCVGCHNERQKAIGASPIALDSLDVSNTGAAAEHWEKVVLKLRAGLMPPAGMPRPDRATQDGFASWLERELDRASAARPNPGRTEPFHRLNRAEYQNAIRDLLHLNVDVAALLPADDVSAGFDNVASTLTMSPTLMDRYLVAAQRVARLAVGTPAPLPNVDYFRIADDLPQDDQLPGMPFGTRGGTRIRYTFPMDGEYVIKVRLARDMNEGMPSYAEPQQLEVGLDGERLQVFTLPGVPPVAGRGQRGGGATPQNPRQPAREGAAGPDAPEVAQPQTVRPQAREGAAGPDAPQDAADTQPERAATPERGVQPRGGTATTPAMTRQQRNRADENWDVRVPVKAGEREITVAFLKKTSALDETVRLPFLRPYPAGNNVPESRMGAALRSVEISGPHTPGVVGDTPSRRRIFACRPPATTAAAARTGNAGEVACARTILSTLARRAYRRPVTSEDVAPLLALFEEGRSQGGFESGVERALRRLLVSPEFLYRVEVDPPNVMRDAAYRVSDLELASRLSFFLWSSIPDDELLDVAVKGQLRNAGALEQQVRRMMADARADALVKNFAGQWLFLRNVPLTGPAQSDFPDFDDSLRQAFRTETELFVESIVREDRSALDLLRADYTFLNERLALHYGIRTVRGSHFRRYTWPPEGKRAGLLGHGSILTVTSYPDRTSPVVRGKWILENIMGTPPPPPLPDVGDLQSTNGSGTVLSMRERLARHRSNPVCAGCHSMLDPLGLALENYDATGKWRTRGESSQPIDVSAVLPDGTKIEGPDGLRNAILARSDRFVSTLTEKLLTYALGRRLEYYDAPAVRAIVRDAARNDYRFSTGLVLGVVRSMPFQLRRGPS